MATGIIRKQVSAAPRDLATGQRIRRFPLRRYSGWILILLLVLGWQWSAAAGTYQSWPTFTAVLAATYEGLRSGELLRIVLGSLARMFAGFGLGAVIGIGLGLVLGTVPLLARAFAPIVEGLRPLPVPAIVPPLILFLGIDDALKVVVVAFSVCFPVLVSTVGGIQKIDPVLIGTARTFGKSRLRTMFRVVLPASSPAIFAGLRTSLSIALVTTVVAEMIAGSGGIGYFLIESQFAMKPADMYAAVLLLVVVGYVLNRAFVAIEARVLSWAFA